MRAVTSVRNQVEGPRSITIVVDHAPSLLRKCREEFPGVSVVANQGARGASGARNTGARVTAGRVLAFMDDDAVADSDWIAELVKGLNSTGAEGAVGKILPIWPARKPEWFPEAFLWVVGASYEGQFRNSSRVRNGWTGNLAVRRDAFDSVGGFREGFGKIGSYSAPEDTEFCIRVNNRVGELAWQATPSVIVHHVVPEQRVRLSFFVRRCYAEGRGKAALRSVADAELGLESMYLVHTIPRAAVSALKNGLLGRLICFSEAGALFIGMLVVGAGYLDGWFRNR